MENQGILSQNISRQERWWSALVYFFSPFLPAVLFFILDLDEYPFLKSHIYQSLLAGILLALTLPLIIIASLGIGGLVWLILPYWAIKAYGGETITIPWISHYIEEQGWAK